ncbi:MAG: response regulator transcription factor [Candidatus Alcyoniella australis]|nr:response regulator transcription factor [Candidatus Alcyoniella australis]
MQRILVLSDLESTRERLIKALIRAGHSARGERVSGIQWVESAAGAPPSALVVDAAYGNEQIEMRLRRVRHELSYLGFNRTWVLALLRPEDLTGRGRLPGADDFALAGCPDEEIALRVALAEGRMGGGAAQSNMRFSELVIDLESYSVNVSGREVALTLREFELLKTLASSPGKVFNRETLLVQVWGYDYFGGQRTVDVHVRRLRDKLGPAAAKLIQTVRGVGYKFSPPPTRYHEGL